jgi:hypothetical protein
VIGRGRRVHAPAKIGIHEVNATSPNLDDHLAGLGVGNGTIFAAQNLGRPGSLPCAEAAADPGGWPGMDHNTFTAAPISAPGRITLVDLPPSSSATRLSLTAAISAPPSDRRRRQPGLKTVGIT